MANNCLVTKLKGVVDNDNLVKLGYVRLLFFSGVYLHSLGKYGKYEIHYSDGIVEYGEMNDEYKRIPAEKSGYVDVEVAMLNNIEIFEYVDIDKLTPYGSPRSIITAGQCSGNIDNLGPGMIHVQLNTSKNLSGDVNNPKSILLTTWSLTYTNLVNDWNLTTFCQNQVARGRVSGTCMCYVESDGGHKVNFGSSMENPTPEETAQGYQIVY